MKSAMYEVRCGYNDEGYAPTIIARTPVCEVADDVYESVKRSAEVSGETVIIAIFHGDYLCKTETINPTKEIVLN